MCRFLWKMYKLELSTVTIHAHIYNHFTSQWFCSFSPLFDKSTSSHADDAARTAVKKRLEEHCLPSTAYMYVHCSTNTQSVDSAQPQVCDHLRPCGSQSFLEFCLTASFIVWWSVSWPFCDCPVCDCLPLSFQGDTRVWIMYLHSSIPASTRCFKLRYHPKALALQAGTL